jgi:sugar/nucleoside kinase (ribokinase family)
VTASRVAVIGDIIRDIVVHPEGPIQHDTDTPAAIDIHIGGSAANTAAWLGHQGVPVNFAGRASVEDVDSMNRYLTTHGVTPFIQADPTHPTGTIVVIVEGEARSMLTERGANSHLTVSEIPQEFLKGVGLLHMTGYSFFHADNPDDLVGVLDLARQSGARVSVDCSSVGFLEDFGVDAWWDVLSHVDIVRGNADEAVMITGLDDPVEACRAIARSGHLAVITLGADGALWCEAEGDVHSLPAAPLGPAGFVDPVGAGDSFSAGFLAGLSRGNSLEEAVHQGLTLSAMVVSQPGAGPS